VDEWRRLWFVPVGHTGNQNSSMEEVESSGAHCGGIAGDWSEVASERREREGRWRRKDILIVAPYNAQVADLSARLPRNAHWNRGTSFRAGGPPVVIYSMTTSSHLKMRARDGVFVQFETG